MIRLHRVSIFGLSRNVGGRFWVARIPTGLWPGEDTLERQGPVFEERRQVSGAPARLQVASPVRLRSLFKKRLLSDDGAAMLPELGAVPVHFSRLGWIQIFADGQFDPF